MTKIDVQVIMAVKTRPRVQSKHNILLTCFAGTDLFVGAAFQPNFIGRQVYVIKVLSILECCRYHEETHLMINNYESEV